MVAERERNREKGNGGGSPPFEASRSRFEATVARAAALFDRGARLEAAVWSQIAAHFATYRHTGQYASDALESLLASIAQTLPTARGGPARAPRSRRPGRRRVLHVLTRALPVGGHTRAVERWVRNDASSVHALVATAQTEPLPAWLSSAIEATGGFYKSLALPPRDLLWRAARLRGLAREWADAVVLHAHPYDVVPPLALGVDGGPPVLLFNHSDATFWIGTRTADVVGDMREPGHRLSLERRGVARSVLLPIPLATERPLSKVDARRALGLPEDATVLLTSGKDFKFVPFDGCDFFRSAARILSRRNGAILLAVGLSDVRRWQAAVDRIAPGRARVYGPRLDLADFQSAADVYLDPIPAASLTAALEAASLGTPVVALRQPGHALFSSADDPAFAGRSRHAESIPEYEGRAETWIADAEARRREGRAAALSVEAAHMPPAWNAALERALGSLPASHRVFAGLRSRGAPDSGDAFLARFEAAAAPEFTLESCVASSSRYLGNRDRATLFLGGLRGGEGTFQLPARSHLPERWLVLGKRVLRRASSLGGRFSERSLR